MGVGNKNTAGIWKMEKESAESRWERKENIEYRTRNIECRMKNEKTG